MKIHSCDIIRQAEQRLFAEGAVSSAMLMDAAIASAVRLMRRDPEFAHVTERFSCAVVYAGKGNNAGDAIGIARELGFSSIILRCACPVDDMTKDTQDQIARISPQHLQICEDAPALPPGGALLLDGLLGSGAHGALRPKYAALVEEMNALRSANTCCLTLAVDIPTGLDADSGIAQAPTVMADATLAIGCVKPGMVADGAENAVGRLLCVPLPGIDLPESAALALDERILSALPHRAYSCFKNRAGRVCIVAGSVGYTGAARMCSEAALAAGAGIVELYCLAEIYPILAASAAPEIIVRPVANYGEISAERADALLIGPGLGLPDAANRQAVRRLVEAACCPLVLDADGLNIAAAEGWKIPPTSILTPHPGEMRRLFSPAVELSRHECAAAFVQAHPCTLLLKGARTIITNGRETYYNTTGGPYMANGGQGDVLAGTIAALAAQGLAPVQAAALGAYLCGRAATRAMVAQGYSIAVRATQLLPWLTGRSI